MSEIKDVNEIDESEILTPEQIAEIEAQKNQELFGNRWMCCDNR